MWLSHQANEFSSQFGTLLFLCMMFQFPGEDLRFREKPWSPKRSGMPNSDKSWDVPCQQVTPESLTSYNILYFPGQVSAAVDIGTHSPEGGGSSEKHQSRGYCPLSSSGGQQCEGWHSHPQTKPGCLYLTWLPEPLQLPLGLQVSAEETIFTFFWKNMLSYSNQKVERLEKLKALTFTLRNPTLPRSSHFSCCFGLGDWKSYYFASNFSSCLFPLHGAFLCWKRGLFKAAHKNISAWEWVGARKVSLERPTQIRQWSSKNGEEGRVEEDCLGSGMLGGKVQGRVLWLRLRCRFLKCQVHLNPPNIGVKTDCRDN